MKRGREGDGDEYVVNTRSFVNARASEIQVLSQEVADKKQQRIMQQLPFHKQRRQMTFSAKRMPKRVRDAASRELALFNVTPKPFRHRAYRRRPRYLAANFAKRQRPQEQVWFLVVLLVVLFSFVLNCWTVASYACLACEALLLCSFVRSCSSAAPFRPCFSRCRKDNVASVCSLRQQRPSRSLLGWSSFSGFPRESFASAELCRGRVERGLSRARREVGSHTRVRFGQESGCSCLFRVAQRLFFRDDLGAQECPRAVAAAAAERGRERVGIQHQRGCC